MTWGEILSVLAIVLSLANTAALYVVLRMTSADTAIGTRQGLPLGAALPAFAATAQDGRPLTDADAHGVLMLFLGADCRSCHAVARELQAIDSAHIPPLLVGVLDRALDEGDDLFALLDFVSPGRVFADAERQIADRLAVPGTPFVYAIDRDGRVRAKHAALTADRLEQLRRFTVDS